MGTSYIGGELSLEEIVEKYTLKDKDGNDINFEVAQDNDRQAETEIALMELACMPAETQEAVMEMAKEIQYG